MIDFTLIHPRATQEMLGFIPAFLSELDPRPAREQFAENYAHGGGWNPFEGFTFNPESQTIKYPGDPVYMPLAYAELREEMIIVYQYAWVLILQPDGTYEISRMD